MSEKKIGENFQAFWFTVWKSSNYNTIYFVVKKATFRQGKKNWRLNFFLAICPQFMQTVAAWVLCRWGDNWKIHHFSYAYWSFCNSVGSRRRKSALGYQRKSRNQRSRLWTSHLIPKGQYSQNNLCIDLPLKIRPLRPKKVKLRTRMGNKSACPNNYDAETLKGAKILENFF